jgi:signal transduction histidine kinase
MKIFAVIIAITIAMFMLFNAGWFKLLVLTILYQGIGIVCDYSVILLLGRMFPILHIEQMETFGISCLITIVSRIVLLFIVLIIRRKMGKNTEDMLTEFEWLEMLIIPTITILSIITIILKFNVLKQSVQDDVLLYIALGMAVMNIVVFFLMESIFKREKMIRDNRVLSEKMKNETEMYYSISDNLDKQRKLTHEFKNHINCISELIRNDDYLELKKYTEKLDKDLMTNTDVVDTNNIIVNAVINTKYREATEKGIVFVLVVNDLSELELSDMDIVIILSNLLNNAIEACEKCTTKIIKLKFIMEDRQTIISVKNSTKEKPIKKGNTILTSKSYMVEEHGIGIKNMIDVIEKYDGKYLIDYDEAEFSFSIVI